jgi:predicted metal-dependent hydrolase
LISAESLPYLGRQYRIEMTDDEGAIRFEQKFLIPRGLADKSEVFRKWFIAKAEEKILPRVALHARNLGVTYKKAKIGDGKYRWGSCTPNDNVIFNWRLIKAPIFVIDYVVVHELAHLIESKHAPEFWNIVKAQALPWKKPRHVCRSTVRRWSRKFNYVGTCMAIGFNCRASHAEHESKCIF